MISSHSPFDNRYRSDRSLYNRLKSLSRYRSKGVPPEPVQEEMPDPNVQAPVAPGAAANPNIEQGGNSPPSPVEGATEGGSQPQAPQAPQPTNPEEGGVQKPVPPKKPKVVNAKASKEEVANGQKTWGKLSSMKDKYNGNMNEAVADYALNRYEKSPKTAGKFIGMMLALSSSWDREHGGEGADQARVLRLIKQQGGKEAAQLINEIRKAYTAYDSSKSKLTNVRNKYRGDDRLDKVSD